MRLLAINQFMGSNGPREKGEIFEEHPVTAIYLIATNKARAVKDSPYIYPEHLDSLVLRASQLQKQADFYKRKADRLQKQADEKAKELKKKQAEYAKQGPQTRGEPEVYVGPDLTEGLHAFERRTRPVVVEFNGPRYS